MAKKSATAVKTVRTKAPAKLQKEAQKLQKEHGFVKLQAKDPVVHQAIVDIAQGLMPEDYTEDDAGTVLKHATILLKEDGTVTEAQLPPKGQAILDDVKNTLKNMPSKPAEKAEKPAKAEKAAAPKQEPKKAEPAKAEEKKPLVIAGVTITLKVLPMHQELMEKLIALDPDNLMLIEKVNYFTIMNKKGRIVFTVERTGKDDKYTLLFNRTEVIDFIPFFEKHFGMSKEELHKNKLVVKEPEGFYFDGNNIEDAMAMAEKHYSYASVNQK